MRTGLFITLFVVALLLPATAAGDGDRCTCVEGNACYHFLNAPGAPPDDPCSCPRCRAATGSCAKMLPEGWNRDCANGKQMECFLRRHAASWRIACSERLSGTCACRRQPHPEWCPRCGEDGADWGREDLGIIERQLRVERRLLGPKRKLVVVKSPHFYLVTDIPKIRIRLQRGGVRWIGMHELAHLYVQRAEIAWADFVGVFGDRMTYGRPCAIYLLEDEKTKQRISTQYLGGWEPELLYGADAETIADGYGYNGLAISTGKYLDDYALHFQMRHLLGHLLISCWVKGGGAVEILPKWMYAGAGHWLSRLPEKFAERAGFCSGEGFAVTDSGRRWDMKIRKIAGDSGSIPIQRILDENSFEGLSLEAHVRASSWFDVCLREDRERFLAFLAAIRERTDQRAAMKAAFGGGPEEFDRRWRARVLGKRPTIAPTPAELDAAEPDRPGARERHDFRNETDAATLVSRIRALESVEDPLTTATLVPRLGSDSENVRETIVVVLSRTRSPEVRTWLRTEGLDDHEGVPRAYVARVLGNLHDAEAADALAGRADDPSWLVRAHVARALGLLGEESRIPLLATLVADRAPKVRIAAMDALARFGPRAARTWRAVAEQLAAKAWPVRSAAADCLGTLGEQKAVEALIERMEQEAGRLRRDIREALKKLTKDDLGNDPRYWREFWEREKVRRGGALPQDAEAPEPPKGEHDYAENPPTYYGLQVYSRGVGYVLDASGSMNFRIELDPRWLKRHEREYDPVGPKFTLARDEIAASLATLDPRTRFNLYCFRTSAESWRDDLVPATPANVEKAVGKIETWHPPDRLTLGGAYRTNYVDAFRLVLDVKEGDLSAGFRDTPDTIYFLTDGKPTTGDITDTDVLLSWFREQNRFARMKVNVLTFGKLESNPVFLRRLAEENGGRFVEVPASR